MAEERSQEMGALERVEKQVSEADVALFELVTRDDQLEAEEPPKPARPRRQAVPFPLIAALLASAAARHIPRPATARFERAEVCFSAPAYTEDTLSAVAEIAEIAGHEASGQTLHVRARCENQEGLALACGDFYLRAE